jgi:hypothetical protein
VWTTILQGVTAAGWHFLGWALLLVGSAGWAARSLPRALCALYLSGGIASLFVYLFPELEGTANALGVFWAAWQGVLFLRAGAENSQAAGKIANQPG